MAINQIAITGIGAYLPEHVRTNDWWDDKRSDSPNAADILGAVDRAAESKDARVDPEIIRYAAEVANDPFRGSVERRVLDSNMVASDIEALAAEEAMRSANIAASDIDFLLTFSQVPDFPCPGNHARVASKLGVPTTATTMTVGADCASFIPHVEVATALLQTEQYRRGLIIQSNASSRVVDWQRPNSIAVGDAAVACVVEPSQKGGSVLGTNQISLGKYHSAVRIAPKGKQEQRWYRGDEHNERLVFGSMDKNLTIEAGGKAVSLCRDTCLPLLDRCRTPVEDVTWFVCSQPTIWFGQACAEGLGIDPERSISTFTKYAHPMPASAPLNLWHGASTNRFKDDDIVLVYSPGAGFVNGAVLYRWQSLGTR